MTRERNEVEAVDSIVSQDPETGAGAYLIDGGLSGGVGETCERQARPAPVPVPSLSPLALLLLVLAILATLALLFTPGGQAGGLVLARVVVAVLFAVVLAPSSAYAAQPKVCCVPKPVPHRGGNLIHNACADLVPPNLYPGMDSRVDGKNFDSLGEPKTLFEAKTYNFDNCTSRFCLRVLQDMWMKHDFAQLERYRQSAHYCGYSFVLLAGDWRYTMAMEGAYDWFITSPICLQPRK